ncbi:MAG TPA: hypothetical protein VFJ85_14450 [Acidimicrobiales bacterium]|nr:hypothetical protein [Acidimicrobiales bacterium]
MTAPGRGAPLRTAMWSPGNVRFVFRFGGVMVLLGAAVVLVVAFTPFGRGHHAPIAVPAGTPARLPAPAAFGSGEVLYGRFEGDDVRDGDLGCRVTTASGSKAGDRVWTVSPLDRLRDRRIGTEVLAPLATVTKVRGGWLLTCDGPLARSAQPLFLAPNPNRVAPALLLFGCAVGMTVLGLAALGVSRRYGRSPAWAGRPMWPPPPG